MDCANGLAAFKIATEGLADTSARKRLEMMYDNNTFTELGRFTKNGDDDCGVITAFGHVSGIGVYCYSQDVSVKGGAIGKIQANKIKKLYDLAIQNGAPIVGIFDSKGAFINEGLDALDSYGTLIKAAGNISGVVPQISVIMGSCIGSAAILAAQADITVMLKDAELCVTSKSILGNEEVGSSQTAAKNGTATIVVDDEISAFNKVTQLLSYLPENNLSVPPVANYIPSPNPDCPINMVVDSDSFIEFSSEYGKSSRVGLARIGGSSVGIVATGGSGEESKIYKNDASKIARFVRFCDAFSLPIITLLDSNGFLGDTDAEINGDVKAVAMLTHAYSEATTPKITVITGKAYGSSYTAMAGKSAGTDFVMAWYSAEIAALEPMTAVQLMYKDRLGNESRESLENEYKNTVASPLSAAANGFIDDVIAPEHTADKIITILDMLSSKRITTLDKKHSNIQL